MKWGAVCVCVCAMSVLSRPAAVALIGERPLIFLGFPLMVLRMNLNFILGRMEHLAQADCVRSSL